MMVNGQWDLILVLILDLLATCTMWCVGILVEEKYARGNII